MTSEVNQVVPAIMAALRKLDGLKVVKIHIDGYTEEGTPDLIGSYRGRAFAFECKNDTYKPSKKQLYELDRWRDSCAIVGVVRTAREALDLLQDEKILGPFVACLDCGDCFCLFHGVHAEDCVCWPWGDDLDGD